MRGRQVKLDALDLDEPLFDPWEAAAATVRGELEQLTGRRQQAQMRRQTFRQWADLVPEPRGPLDFTRFAWQAELYDQRAAEDHEQVYMKATQVGVSTQAIRWLLWHADVHQRVCLYTFPTDRELSAFSRQRIRPVIRSSDHLRARMTADGVDNVEQKQIGFDGWAYFRGTNKPIDSVNADVVVFDEYDTSDQANIEASERRVTGPDSAGLIRRVGVPSIPGFGIGGLYDASDQRVWTVKCDCGEWNPLRGYDAFEANVDQDRMMLVCRKCRVQLDVRAGEWVATYPERPVRGYHVNKMMVPGSSLAILVANSLKTRPDQIEAFHTRDLGEPFAPAEGRLSLEAVRACTRVELRVQEALVSYRLVTMGVDVASARDLNVVIEESLTDDYKVGRVVWAGTIAGSLQERLELLGGLMDRFTVNMAAIDSEPDGMFSEAFARNFPGRVYRVSFFTPSAQGRQEPPMWNIRDDEQFASLHRTKFYDMTFHRFRSQQILLPPLDSLPAEYPDHLGNLYRRRLEMPGGVGRERIDYVRTGPEDFAQCEAYVTAAILLFQRREGLEMLNGGPVPVADELDFEPLDLSSYGGAPGYAPPFSG